MASLKPSAARPLAPHLTVWKWRVNMTVSILHRITGNAMAFGAVALFLWWLAAVATGPAAYRIFYSVATGWPGIIIGIGLTWTVFQHMSSGIRHLVMDTGAAFDLATTRASAILTLLAASVLTALIWAYLFATKGF